MDAATEKLALLQERAEIDAEVRELKTKHCRRLAVITANGDRAAVKLWFQKYFPLCHKVVDVLYLP